MIEAGRHIPVDVTDGISILVFANLAKGHALALECRMVFAGKQVLGQSPGLYFYLPYLFYKLTGFHNLSVRVN
jgi:hypothetical protein